jgi:nicotinate phosphoribosyltransferase
MRQDSGDEYKIGNMIINRYKELGIGPKSKTIVFSNALTMDKWKEISEYFNGRINISAGIGTHLTCDPGIENYKAANIVMKLTRCRMSPKDPWEDVIKISDDFGKHMGNPELFEMAKKELHLNIA